MKKINLFGHTITIEKRPKMTAEDIFDDIRYELRDVYDKDYWEYFTVRKDMYKEIKRLARDNYQKCTGDTSGEILSYYRFEVVKSHLYGKVTFRVANN